MWLVWVCGQDSLQKDLTQPYGRDAGLNSLTLLPHPHPPIPQQFVIVQNKTRAGHETMF